jgi:uncharacterized protein (TIGR02145 family)
MKTILSFLSRAAHLSPRSGIYRPSGLLSPAGHFIARSAFILLLWLGGGCVLFAQGNGVKVSNLLVSAGTPSTVTFDVQWTNDHAPEFVWSDTVWVWVDYNNNGVMERLPLSGATLTATSALDVGKVVEDAGNNQGRWLVGNARDASTFSATVQLLTALANFSGVCAYASNYPPMGEYISSTEISFTGTPPYNIVLKNNSGGTETSTADSPYTVLPGYTVQSFTDKTGAPGTLSCMPSKVYDLQVSASTFCEGGAGVTFALSGTDKGASYELYRNGTLEAVATLAGTGTPATFSGSFRAGTYSACTIPGGGFCPAEMNESLPVIIVPGTTPANATVDFTAFCPSPGAATGTVWYLTDTRDGGNSYTYKVKKMQDGRIWMVQDLKFGTCPNDLTHWNDDNSEAATTHTPTVHDKYVGHCRSTTYMDAGFLYNWPATMQNTKAYYGSTFTVGCSGTATGTTGTAPGVCQGICPVGWHIPTGASAGEYQALHNAMELYDNCSGGKCWNASSQWEGVLVGYCYGNGTLNEQGRLANYWSSTYSDRNNVYDLHFTNIPAYPGIYFHVFPKDYGFALRCVRNY